jgi:hypothetical protein
MKEFFPDTIQQHIPCLNAKKKKKIEKKIMITPGEKSVGESAPFRVICMCVYDKPGISRKTNGEDGDEDKKKEAKITHKEIFFLSLSLTKANQNMHEK